MKHILKSVDIFPTRALDQSLPWLDYSTLAAIERCPREGITQYVGHKQPVSRTMHRAMALEAGTAFHAFCAAFNLYLMPDGPNKTAGLSVFDPSAVEYAAQCANRTRTAKATIFATQILDSLGYEDDPEDNKRTYDNLLQSCSTWAAMNENRPFKVVAVEQSFDLTLVARYSIEAYMPKSGTFTSDDQVLTIRLVGKIDAVCDLEGGLFPLDYKLLSKVDKNTITRWELDSQPTIYRWALPSLLTKLGMTTNTKILQLVGLELTKIPIAARATVPQHTRELIERTDIHNKATVLNIIRTATLIREFETAPWMAPTHNNTSCYRYFSVCPFLHSYCVFDDSTRAEVFNNELVPFNWDPTESN